MEDTYTRDSKPSEIIKTDDLVMQSAQEYSRYRSLKRLMNANGDSFIETPDRIVFKESTSDNFYKVEAGFVNRLDLISNMFYGTPKLWWVLAYVNHLDDPFKVDSGVILRVPKRSSIRGI